MEKNNEIAEIKRRLDALEGDETPTKDKALIHIVLDRSGSMDSIWGGVKEGFDAFIKEQQEFNADVSLHYFDDVHGQAFTRMPVKKVKKLASYKEIFARGSTALLDAVGDSIKTVEARASDYAKIVFVVYTDGLENASKDWTTPRVRDLIRKHRNKWQFVYLGANQDAWAVGTGLGFYAHGTRTFDRTPGGASAGYGATSIATSDFLRGTTMTVNVQDQPVLEPEEATTPK